MVTHVDHHVTKSRPKHAPYRTGAGPRPRGEGVAAFLKRTGRPKEAHAFELATRDGGRRAEAQDRQFWGEVGPKRTEAVRCRPQKADRKLGKRYGGVAGLATMAPSGRIERRLAIKGLEANGYIAPARTAPLLRGINRRGSV